MPTLLEKGKIVKAKWMDPVLKREIDTKSSIEVLVDFITDRSWVEGEPPKMKLKSLGDKVIVLKSGTGSGKSTILPPELHKKFFESKRKNIIVTEPTVVIASDVPYQIIMWNDLTLGQDIGFQTGSLVLKPVKGILFSTPGILLQHLKTLEPEQFMKKYAFVIIDEVHLRSMEVDSCLFYLKRLLVNHWDDPECPTVILMSATFDEKIYMNYFRVPKHNYLEVVGATFPIEDNFAPFDLSNYEQYCVDLVEKIHIDNITDITENNNFRDIMIFVQGSAQMRTISDQIHYLNKEVFTRSLEEIKKHSDEQWSKYKKGGVEQPHYYIAPIKLMSANVKRGDKQYQDLFSDIETVLVNIYEFDGDGKRTETVIKQVPASRRVILATNVAETGLTVDTLKYCIDTGYTKDVSFNPSMGCQLLVDKQVTRASSHQRRGRVGRKAPGVFYGCYTKDIYNQLDALPFPTIVLQDISDYLLSLIIDETETEELSYVKRDADVYQKNQFDQTLYKLESKTAFHAPGLDFLDYPPHDSISYSLEKMHGLGFIDHEYFPTLFGYYGNKFRKLTMENIRMILAGYHTGAYVLDLITIACFIQGSFGLINKRKYIPRDPLGVKDKSHKYYQMLFMDEFIEYLFIWYEFMSVIEKTNGDQKKMLAWSKKTFFKLDILYAIAELRDEVINDMLNMGLNPYYNGLDLPRGAYSLTKLLKKNLADNIGEIRKLKNAFYEGYRFNLCSWNEVLKRYTHNHYHYPVEIDSKLLRPLNYEVIDVKQPRPKYILVSSIMLQPSQTRQNMYDFVGQDISILDGWVDVDTNFLTS